MPKNNCSICDISCFGIRCQKCYLSTQKKNKGWFKINHIPWTTNKKLSEIDGYINGMTGKKHTQGTLNKMKISAINKHKLEKNGRWLGGKSFEKYGHIFNEKLRESIRERDNNMCQICNKLTKYKLSVHHIDYNKKNNNENNLISLCKSHHSKTNINRDYWKWQLQVFMNIHCNAQHIINFNGGNENSSRIR